MKKISCVTLTALLFILAFAFSSFAQENPLQGYSASFTLIGDTTIVEETFTFVIPQTSFSWYLPEDAEAVEVSDGLMMIQKGEEGEQKIKISGNFQTLTLKYLTDALIEKTKDRFFLADLGKVIAPEILVTVKLPEGSTLKYPLNAQEISLQTSVIPKTSKVTTDGKNIILQWDENDLQQGKAILIRYQEQKKFLQSEIIVALILLFILFLAVFLFFHKKKLSVTEGTEVKEEKEETKAEQSLKEKLTRNLFEEERAIMETLLEVENHELWQKQLALKTGISAVKLSRRLRNLEAKGLIEKIPYGNTNKIRIKEKKLF